MEQQSHYQRYIKPRLQNDADFKAKYQAYQSNKRKLRYANDDNFRQAVNTRAKLYNVKKYQENVDYREKQKSYSRQKYLERKLQTS